MTPSIVEILFVFLVWSVLWLVLFSFCAFLIATIKRNKNGDKD